MHHEDIMPGMLVKHVPTGTIYFIESFGLLRLPGERGWMTAARYRNFAHPAGEFYRPLTDFENFVEVEDDELIGESGVGVGRTGDSTGNRVGQRGDSAAPDAAVGGGAGRDGTAARDDSRGQAVVPAGAADQSRLGQLVAAIRDVQAASTAMEGRKAWAEVDAILAAYDRRQYDVMVANYDNRSDNDSRISTKLTGEVSIDGVRYTVSSSQFLYERRPRDVHGWGVWTRCTEAEAAKVANSDKWQTRRWVLDVATGEHKPEYPSYEALLLALRQLHDAVRGWPEPGGPSVVEAQKRAEELLNAKPVTPPWE